MTDQDLINWINNDQAWGVNFYIITIDEDGDSVYENIDPSIEEGDDFVVL